MQAYALPYQGSELVAEKLVKEFISVFGVPLELHTDQGSNFQSELFKEVCKLLQISQTRTTPYHPASNGQVEWFNRTLLQMIRCYLAAGQSHWDERLPLLLAAYRNTPHPATGFTPNHLMFGREGHQPQDVILLPPDTIREPLEHRTYLERLQDSTFKARKIARDCLQHAHVRQKRLYDINVLQNKFEVGGLVPVLNTGKTKGKCPKLQSIYNGPFVVTKIYGPVIYEVRNHKKEASCTKTNLNATLQSSFQHG